ncbi:hypothetical protein KI387_035625, partial [Taxus chinensis]
MAMATRSVTLPEIRSISQQTNRKTHVWRIPQFRLCFRSRKSVKSSREDLPGSFRAPSRQHGKLPEIIGHDAELLSKLTTLERPYVPFPLLGNRHVETIFASLFRSLPVIRFRRECLRMADGGTVALDWPIAGKDAEVWNMELPVNAPVVILLKYKYKVLCKIKLHKNEVPVDGTNDLGGLGLKFIPDSNAVC